MSNWQELPADDRRQDAGDESGDGTFVTVSVSALGPTDIPALRSFPVIHRLDQPDATLRGGSMLVEGIRSALPRFRRRQPAFIARTGDHRLGYAGFVADPQDGRWTITTLAAAMGVYAAEPLWEALIHHAVQQAGLRGIRTIYARLPNTTNLEHAFQHENWTAFATETVFLGRDLRVTGSSAMMPRAIDIHDTWAVHQLYATCVPREVQQAEAWTSRRWEVPKHQPATQLHLSGWVFDRGSDLAGYARVVSSGDRHVVEFLIHPDDRNQTPQIIDGLLRAIASRGLRRVSVVVRGYQSELAHPLEAAGFTPVFEQTVLVRHTTARVKRRVTNVIRFPFHLRERSARRVPTMLRRTSEDGLS